ncbi:unnamed protein product [Amoebophrya sp. A120]|nr:unnamed protein product [Amoebophrya sp. A120]|eukprot:GSA120T00013702001.1
MTTSVEAADSTRNNNTEQELPVDQSSALYVSKSIAQENKLSQRSSEPTTGTPSTVGNDILLSREQQSSSTNSGAEDSMSSATAAGSTPAAMKLQADTSDLTPTTVAHGDVAGAGDITPVTPAPKAEQGKKAEEEEEEEFLVCEEIPEPGMRNIPLINGVAQVRDEDLVGDGSGDQNISTISADEVREELNRIKMRLPKLKFELETPEHIQMLRDFRTEPCDLPLRQCLQKRGKGCLKYHNSQHFRRPLLQEDGETLAYFDMLCRFGDNCPLMMDCPFAHSKTELLVHPAKFKTRCCDSFKCFDDNCCFVHEGDRDRREFAVHYSFVTEAHPDDFQPLTCIPGNENYVKPRGGKLCGSYPNPSNCPYGTRCRFAHRRQELGNLLFRPSEENVQEITDEFLILKYKTKWCPHLYQHNWTYCVYAHNYQDYRRNPQVGYGPVPCPFWDPRDTAKSSYNDRCKFGAQCPFSHGSKERAYHPLNFKVSTCQDIGPGEDRAECTREPFCAFYHNDLDKRPIVPHVMNYSKPLPIENLVKYLQKDFFDAGIGYNHNAKRLNQNERLEILKSATLSPVKKACLLDGVNFVQPISNLRPFKDSVRNTEKANLQKVSGVGTMPETSPSSSPVVQGNKGYGSGDSNWRGGGGATTSGGNNKGAGKYNDASSWGTTGQQNNNSWGSGGKNDKNNNSSSWGGNDKSGNWNNAKGGKKSSKDNSYGYGKDNNDQWAAEWKKAKGQTGGKNSSSWDDQNSGYNGNKGGKMNAKSSGNNGNSWDNNQSWAGNNTDNNSSWTNNSNTGMNKNNQNQKGNGKMNKGSKETGTAGKNQYGGKNATDSNNTGSNPSSGLSYPARTSTVTGAAHHNLVTADFGDQSPYAPAPRAHQSMGYGAGGNNNPSGDTPEGRLTAPAELTQGLLDHMTDLTGNPLVDPSSPGGLDLMLNPLYNPFMAQALAGQTPGGAPDHGVGAQNLIMPGAPAGFGGMGGASNFNPMLLGGVAGNLNVQMGQFSGAGMDPMANFALQMTMMQQGLGAGAGAAAGVGGHGLMPLPMPQSTSQNNQHGGYGAPQQGKKGNSKNTKKNNRSK